MFCFLFLLFLRSPERTLKSVLCDHDFASESIGSMRTRRLRLIGRGPPTRGRLVCFTRSAELNVPTPAPSRAHPEQRPARLSGPPGAWSSRLRKCAGHPPCGTEESPTEGLLGRQRARWAVHRPWREAEARMGGGGEREGPRARGSGVGTEAGPRGRGLAFHARRHVPDPACNGGLEPGRVAVASACRRGPRLPPCTGRTVLVFATHTGAQMGPGEPASHLRPREGRRRSRSRLQGQPESGSAGPGLASASVPVGAGPRLFPNSSHSQGPFRP